MTVKRWVLLEGEYMDGGPSLGDITPGMGGLVITQPDGSIDPRHVIDPSAIPYDMIERAADAIWPVWMTMPRVGDPLQSECREIARAALVDALTVEAEDG